MLWWTAMCWWNLLSAFSCPIVGMWCCDGQQCVDGTCCLHFHAPLLVCDVVMDSNVLMEPAVRIFMPHCTFNQAQVTFLSCPVPYSQIILFYATICSTGSVIQHINITHEMAISCNPHNLSCWDTCIAKQLGYKHTFCQNPQNPACPYIFVKM